MKPTLPYCPRLVDDDVVHDPAAERLRVIHPVPARCEPLQRSLVDVFGSMRVERQQCRDPQQLTSKGLTTSHLGAVDALPTARSIRPVLRAATTSTPTHMTGITEASEPGKLIPKIARTVPLSGAVETLTELEAEGTPKGKLVIECALGRGRRLQS